MSESGSFDVKPRDFAEAYERIMEALTDAENGVSVKDALIGGAFLAAINAAHLGIKESDLDKIFFWAKAMAYSVVKDDEEEE